MKKRSFPKNRSDAERILDLSQPEPNSGCWLWLGVYDPLPNYIRAGKFRLNGKLQRAARASFIIFKNDIPEGACILHKCDNPGCINPDHLYDGNQLQNSIDKMSRGRGNRTLSAGQAAAIRRLKPYFTNWELARFFGVQAGTISAVINFRSWRKNYG